MKRRSPILLVAGVVVALAALGVWLFGDVNQPAQASGPVIVGFDMNTGDNSCPNNGTDDCTLGTIEPCVMTGAEGSVEFDVYLQNLPVLQHLTGGSYHIGETHDITLGSISAIKHDDPYVNLWAQLNSVINDTSDPLGTFVPSFDARVKDTVYEEYNPPFTQGTLGRYTLNLAGVPIGYYSLTLDSVEIRTWGIPPDLCSIYGCDIRDGFDDYGLIAVGMPCPAPAVGGTTELVAGGSDSAASPPTAASGRSMPVAALAGVAAAALLALTAGAWYARRRWGR